VKQTGLGVVFDCNVLLQAAARGKSPAAACLRLAEDGFVRLYASPETLDELSEVLRRPKIKTRFPELTEAAIDEFLGRLNRTAEVIKRIPRRFAYPRDVGDEPYINLAIEVEAAYIVSHDNDLLDLMTGHTDECKEFRQRFRPLRVVGPLAFLREVEKGTSF
jgi:uncharacterized protein